MALVGKPYEFRPYLGPLRPGQRVAIVGGGPSGASCAIALRRLATTRRIDLEVVLFEARDFTAESNVCVGVLSPPFRQLLQQLDLRLPEEMIQRVARGYVLHAEHNYLVLDDDPAGEPTLVVHRGDLDRLLLEKARALGAQVIDDIVVDLRRSASTVLAVGSGGTRVLADAVVGAVGLNRFALAIFESCMGDYRRPQSMNSILIEVPMDPGIIEERLGNRVHAILPPSLPRIEFGALTPKRDRVVVNAAGEEMDDVDFDLFLRLPPVQHLLENADLNQRREYEVFPTSPAKHFARDRIVAIGNASGLMRPLKGKGINTGILMGIRTASTMMEVGISEKAFRELYKSCADITGEYSYGLALRWLYRTARRMGWMDALMELSKRDALLRQMFHGMVSGEGSYRQIVRRSSRPALALRTAWGILRYQREAWKRSASSGSKTALVEPLSDAPRPHN